MRLSRSLAGKWQFQLDPEGNLRPETLQPDCEITVPLPWQTEYPALREYKGYGWYQRVFDLTDAWLDGEILLHFGAVDYWCRVYINGEKVGEHEGGYTPFSFPLRSKVRAGENTLTVLVYDTVQEGQMIPRWWHHHDQAASRPPFDADNIPHGKQTWYVDVSGIWQDVTLTAVPRAYIRHMRVVPNIQGNAQITIELANPQTGTLVITIDDQTASVTTKPNETIYTLSVSVEQPHLWTMDTPNLYQACAALTTETDTDEMCVRFGFREIAAHHGKLWLNGEPIMLISALDQDIYPETIYTPPSKAFLRDQFEKAKALGLNSLRCHIKLPDPLYLDLADEIGLLIWAEIPSWRTWHVKTTVHPAALYMDDALKNRVRQTLEEMIERDFNHPSLMIWTIVNEDWGTALQLSAHDRMFVREVYDLCKQLDPTRLCVDNSPCPAPWGYSPHVKTDINDFHIYTNIPDQAKTFEQFVHHFSLRPAWTFSLHGDGQPRGDEPLILSEFGNWGLPSLRNIANGSEPEWFSLGPWWNPFDGEPGFPQGVEKRFEALGLNAIWKDYEAFAEATQWHQYTAMKYEIETMRRLPTLAGYVITELTDTYWESNGLLDFTRGTKTYHQKLSQINAEDVILPRLNRYVYWDDETIPTAIYVSHYSAKPWSSVRIQATLGSDRSFEMILPHFERGETQGIGAHRWSFQQTDELQTILLQAQIAEADETILTQQETPIVVLPASFRYASYTEPIAVITSQAYRTSDLHLDDLPTPTAESGVVSGIDPVKDDSDANTLTLDMTLPKLGYKVTKRLSDSARLLITDYTTVEILEWVQAGGDMLLLSSGNNPFFWQHSRGGVWGGSWISTFSWLRSGVYSRLNNVSNPLSLPFIGVMPLSTLLGLPVYDSVYHRDFLAGQIGGWVHHPAIHTVQFRYGHGRVILTTFKIEENLPSHPIAVAMLHDLVDYLTSDACQPNLTA